MNGITHKQAKRYMLADLDGRLTENQRRDLQTHLDSCPTCLSDSESFATLTTRLHTEFHSRWDTYDGPSTNVMNNIRAQSRRITMKKRFDLAFNIFGGAVTLLVVVFVISSIISQFQKKSAASNGTQANVPNSSNTGNLIAFVSKQDGNNDIYIMKSDGSDVINLTKNPADDNSPVWSLDGTRLAFVSNRDGNDNIYVMNSDGSNLIRITDNIGQDTNPVWSFDGIMIAYASGDVSKNNTNIYVVDVNGQNKKRLTNYSPNITVSPEAWSPDSQFILFEINRQIVQVGVRDGNITPLTPLTESDIYVPSRFILSASGLNLTYLTWCNQREQGASGFCEVVKTINRYATQEETKGILRIQNICELKDISNSIAYFGKTLWSPDRTKIIFAFFCEGHGGFFYIANADGTDFKSLTNEPVLTNATAYAWSYDSQSIIFASGSPNDSNHDSLFTLNINAALADPNIQPTLLNSSASQVSSIIWQPVPNYEAVIIPTQEPKKNPSNDRLIAFTSEKSGNAEIYTMKPDGSDLKNLTNNPLAKDINPVWSPDGKRIAYESELSGFMQIYLMNADGSHVTQLTSDQADHKISGQPDTGSVWSPDGQQIIFSQRSKDNEQRWTLYVMNIDTGQKIQLFDQPAEFWYPAWSPDGKHIAFIPQVNQHPEANRLYVVDSDGSNLSDVTRTLPSDEAVEDYPDYYWSHDGQFIFFIASNVNYVAQNGLGGDNNNIYKWRAYEASLDGRTLLLNASTHSPIGGWQQGTYFVMSLTGSSSWNWINSNGKTNTVNPMRNCQDSSGSAQAYKQSSNGNVVIGAGCTFGDWWLFTMNSNGTTFTSLINSPFHAPDGGMNFSWSPDDKFVAITMTTPKNTDMYILNIAESQKDPSIQPVKVSMGGGQLFYLASWQPIAKNDIVKENPTPAPTQTFRFGDSVETTEQALIAAPSALSRSFNYVEPLVVITVKQGNPEEFSMWAGSSSPAPKKVWVVVYFNTAWKSTFTAPSSFAYDDQGVVVTIPPEMLTPPPPFRGCVVVVINASNGETMSVGGLPQGNIPECDQ